MSAQSEFREALATMDVAKARTIWGEVFPNLPLGTRDEAIASMHIARTASEFLPLALRAYSHAWLMERGLPTMLPDELKPKAQQIHPVIAIGVGIAVKGRSDNPDDKAALVEIRQSMESAVLEAEADRKLDDADHVKRRMMEARLKTLHRLFG
jgi:hypothetical protein